MVATEEFPCFNCVYPSCLPDIQSAEDNLAGLEMVIQDTDRPLAVNDVALAAARKLYDRCGSFRRLVSEEIELLDGQPETVDP